MLRGTLRTQNTFSCNASWRLFMPFTTRCGIPSFCGKWPPGASCYIIGIEAKRCHMSGPPARQTNFPFRYISKQSIKLPQKFNVAITGASRPYGLTS
jgi:hypothetical protein